MEMNFAGNESIPLAQLLATDVGTFGDGPGELDFNRVTIIHDLHGLWGQVRAHHYYGLVGRVGTFLASYVDGTLIVATAIRVQLVPVVRSQGMVGVVGEVLEVVSRLIRKREGTFQLFYSLDQLHRNRIRVDKVAPLKLII